MNNDRELLLGILAFNFEKIDLDQFTAAFKKWAQAPESSFGEILLANEYVSLADLQSLSELLEKVLEGYGGDASAALRERVDPEVRNVITSNADSRLRLTVEFQNPDTNFIRLNEVHPSRHESNGGEGSTEGRSRYALSRIHGTGGLGRVWLARDRILQRSVALKEPKDKSALTSKDILRFVHEAQVAGQLEHPNIVPIYELVHDPEQRDIYYTMRFVQGDTMQEAIAEYQDHIRSGSVKPSELHNLVAKFVSICHAIAYAHARGVAHRDLKPSNVVLGRFGEVSLLDWGLARTIGTVEGDPNLAVQIPSRFRVAENDSRSVQGTLAYMSPEQAAGRLEEVDHRTDIYGLGAILFAILTGHSPHQADNKEDTHVILKRIRENATPRASDENRSIPPALDAICAKAMAYSKASRYETAMELARDVERWLADDDVSVYKTPWSTRTSRWIRRNWNWAITAAAACLVIFISLTYATIRVESARQQEAAANLIAQNALAEEQKARQREFEAKQEATRRFAQSQETVDKMLTGVGQVLEYYPGARAVRVKLLEEAAKTYAEFAHDSSNDPHLQLESGRACVRLGDVQLMLGNHTQAQVSFRKGIEILESVRGDDQLANSANIEAILCRTKLATARNELEATAAAENEISLALELLDKNPNPATTQTTRAMVLLSRARLLARSNPQAARKDLETCETLFLELQKKLSENRNSRKPEQIRLIENIALTRGLLGQSLAATGEFDAAAKVLADSIEAYRELTLLQPDFPPYFDGLAFSKITLANALRPMGREDEQINLLKSAIAEYVTLAPSLPEAPRFAENLAIARLNLAWVLHQRGQNKTSQELLDDAIAALTALCQSPMAIHRYWENLARAAVVLGQVLSDLGEDEAAETNLRNAIAVFETKLLPQQPGAARYLRGIGAAERNYADLLRKLDQLETANQMYFSAAEHLQSALARESEHFGRDELAITLEHRGDLYMAMNSDEDADRAYAAAEALRQMLPDAPEYRFKAVVLAGKSRQEPKRAEALNLAKKLVTESPRLVKYQTQLGAIQLVMEDTNTAIKTLSAVDDASLPLNSPHLFWLARAYAQRKSNGDTEKANQILVKAVERRREHAPGRFELRELQLEVEELLKR